MFVVGMHRSGTSALCAALQASGASFGDNLLAPQAGVNDEGFWEDRTVNRINDALLAEHDSSWFRLSPQLLACQWRPEDYGPLFEQIKALLKQGFGGAALEVVKDPRFCITLPIWLAACAELSIKVSVCLPQRAPLEIARSLQKRDGFPLGYGLRLCRDYLRSAYRHCPEDSLTLSFASLVERPQSVMESLAQSLPITVNQQGLSTAVRSELKHHSQAANQSDVLSNSGHIDIDELDKVLAESYPSDTLLAEFADCLVQRGQALSELGESHSQALQTIVDKDADIAKLAEELRVAYATIAERDQQIADFDSRLSNTGQHLEQALNTIAERDTQLQDFDRRLSQLAAEHSHALEVIRERDEQIEQYTNFPVVGLAVRMIRARNAKS